MAAPKSETLTGGSAIVKSLLRHDVDTVFGLPGVQTYPIFDALYSKLRLITVKCNTGYQRLFHFIILVGN